MATCNSICAVQTTGYSKIFGSLYQLFFACGFYYCFDGGGGGVWHVPFLFIYCYRYFFLFRFLAQIVCVYKDIIQESQVYERATAINMPIYVCLAFVLLVT